MNIKSYFCYRYDQNLNLVLFCAICGLFWGPLLTNKNLIFPATMRLIRVVVLIAPITYHDMYISNL